ncbi:unnamed protein product [Dicrocoelium dendriticum]|nr:unnamed protein product [Dicrocoelium dendriticum]
MTLRAYILITFKQVANLNQCLAHLQSYGFCEQLKAEDLISTRPKALAEVLDSLFNLQRNAKYGAGTTDQVMLKDTKRRLSVQTSKSTIVPPRRIIHTKAGSASPVRSPLQNVQP